MDIQIGIKRFTVVLYDNDTVDSFVQKLPLTLNMNELNGNEKYFYLSGRLPSESRKVGTIKSGDLMLYGPDCLVLFYKNFATSYSYTRLGYITDTAELASALGSGNVQVIFSIVK